MSKKRKQVKSKADPTVEESVSKRGAQDKPKIDPAVMVAIIGLTGTLITVLLGFEPIKHWWENQLNPPTVPVSTAMPNTETTEPAPKTAEPVAPSSNPPVTDASTITPPAATSTWTLPPASGVMTAQIVYNYGVGNAPLTTTFNASSSSVAHPDGKVETCEFAHVCTYSWDVRNKNGAVIHGPEVGESKFSYTFAKKGEYTVVVYVCRGQACNFASANVTVK